MANKNKMGYSEKSLSALKRGTYGKETGRKAKYNTSQEQTQQAKELPKLNGMTAPNKATVMVNNPVQNRQTQQKPSTRYNQNVNTQEQKSTRDTRYDKDFDTFYNYRHGDFSGEVDYDPVQDADIEKWRNVKKDIMAKNKWTEKEFDSKWDEYYKERSQKTANQEVQTAIDVAKKHPVFGTLLQAAYTPQNMIEGAGAMLSNLMPEKYKAQSADDTLFTGTRVKEGIKQAVKDNNIKSNIGKGAYDIGTSLGDMALSTAIPVLGTASLGAQTAARTNMNALERGVDPNKAALTGALAGGISGVMNKIGFDKAAGAEAKTALGKVLKGAGVEGAENVAEDTANLLLDTLINTDKSQIASLTDYYKSQGMSDEQANTRATLDTLGDLAVSGLSGAAFGGVMNGVRNLPELVGDVRALVPELNNKGGVDAPSLIAEARKNMKAPAKVEGKKGNKLVFSPVEGEIRERLQAEYDANTQQIKANEEQINTLKALENSTKGRNKKQYTKQRTALEKENRVLVNQQPELKNLLDGYESTYKGELSREDRATIFDERNGGAYNMINLATKFAGDTPEAKALAKDAKSLLSKYVESGDVEDWYAFQTSLSELSNLAEQTRADYVTKSGNRYSYDDIFNRPADYSFDGNRQESLFDRVDNGEIPKIVQDVHSRYDVPEVKAESAPVDVIKTDQDKLNNLINSKKEGSVELDNGQIIEKYSMKYMKDNILKDYKNQGYMPDDDYIYIKYKDGTDARYGAGDDTSNMKLTNIESVFYYNEATDAFAGDNIVAYPDSNNPNDIHWVIDPYDPQRAAINNQPKIPEVEAPDNALTPQEVQTLQESLGETEIDPNNVIYHAGILSRLNKADSAGKMEGMRDTGYYGTGHYFVDGAHKGEIGEGTGYGNKPYSSVDISKYNNLFKADTDAKANGLHNFSQKMMRFINGYNDKYYTDSEGIVPGELKEYMDDMYSEYKSLFGDKAMSRADFETKLNEYRDNYAFDPEDRGDSAFTTFMKEHGYNGVDTRGTRSADTERGVVIYDLDEDSVLQSNVTDKDAKNGLMNTFVRGENPVFDRATDENIQNKLDSYAKKQQIEQEYRKNFDVNYMNMVESEMQDMRDRIKNIEENVIPYEQMMLEGGEGFEKEVDRTYKEFKQFDPDVTREDIVELLRNNELERSNNIKNSTFELNNLKQRVKEYENIYDNLLKESEAAYKQARDNVNGVTKLPPEYDLATRYAQSYRDFDAYDYDDATFQGDDGIEKMADDIAKGRDLSQYIEALDNMIDEAPDAETQANMQAIRDELSALNEGRVSNEIPNAEPTTEAPTETPKESIINRMMDEPPRSEKKGQSKVGTNTAVNSLVFTRKQIENDPIIKEINSYAKANNDLTFNKAKEDIYSDGATLLDDYTSGRRKIDSDLDVDRAMILLTDMAYKIKAGDEGLEAQRNLLFSRLREAGTLYGQTIQAFKKWNNTPEGAIANANGIIHEPVDAWKSNNKKKVELNAKIAKALEQMGVDSSMRNRTKAEKTHEQIKEGVKNVIEKEFGSIENYFNDNDLEFLTILAEEKKIPVWQITDEIEHKLSTGEWYTLDESTEPKYPINQRLKSALDSLLAQEPAVKEPPTLEEIRNEVRATFDKEMAGAGEFTDDDVNFFASLIQNGATKEEIADFLNTKMATGKVGISEQAQQEVVDLLSYAERFDPDSKQAFDLRSAAYKILAEEAVSDDATPFEKFESWRYLAMLGNPKTMVRNWIGNKMFGAVTGVSNNVSAAIEAGLAKTKLGQNMQRTKAFLNPVDDRALIKAAGEDGDAHRYSYLNGDKYERGVKDAIKKQKSVFNSKAIRAWEALTDRGISDYSAVKKKYSTSLAGYMKANGLDESAFDADDRYRALVDKSRSQLLTDAEKAEMNNLKGTADLLEKARDYAVKQAEYATFHEDNDVAKALTETSNRWRNSKSPIVRGLGYGIEGMLPFKKTPANILKSGFEYSPFGAIKSIAETGKLIYENTGSRKGNLEDTYTKKSNWNGKTKKVDKTLAADVIDSWSRTLTGSGLMLLGMYLKDKGIITSSTDDEKYQDNLEGIQNYGININGHTYSLDWAAPAIMPILMGAELSKIKDKNLLLNQKWYQNIGEITDTVNSILDPMFETSMMQNVKDTMEQLAKDFKYNNDGSAEAIGGIVGNALTNTALGYATQGIPTIAGQLARTIDNTRRSTDTTNKGYIGTLEKQGRKVMNKLPGLSFLNPAYRDSYGRTQQNGPFSDPIRNLAYQTLSPGYYSKQNTTAADESARKAYYALGEPNEEGERKPIMDKEVFPSWKSQVTVNGYKLNPEEMATYRQTSGEAQYAIRDALAKEEWFNNLEGPEQNEILKKVNTLVDKVGKDSVDQLDSSSKEFEAYQEGGVPALLNKWSGEIQTSKAKEETGLSGRTNAVKEIQAAYAEGDTKKGDELTAKYTKYNKERLRLNQKYGVDMDMADFTRREDANPGSNETWAKEHQKTASTNNKVPAVTATNTTVDTSAHEKYINRAGAQSQKYTKDIPKLDEMNFGSSEKYTYAYAINQDSSLTPEKFDTQFKKMDLDNGGSMSQDEMINYFNKTNTSEKEGKYLWRTYGDNKGNPWKAQAVLSNGKWKVKKK